ncbi:MAG: hypothetical protein OHK93_004815 [Ramalina farinacea]|uniref:Ribonuclease H2 subunit B n=1 Tax=Ramalina farinacea TaxID=258253 RepID=A0AA43QX83_9LECA|nr:hypothetical protein [Ramalina farinacea]
MLVLPTELSSDSRICTLAHPRTGKPSRYLFDPEKGIYEFTRIAAPKSACRSWLIHSRHAQAKTGVQSNSNNQGREPGLAQETTPTENEASAQVISKPEMLVATHVDPLFLVLPALCNQTSSKENSKRMFLSLDDYTDKLEAGSKHFRTLLRSETIKSELLSRVNAVCDTVEAGDERMYRLNDGKLLQELLSKAESVKASGLAASMENHFVQKALKVPVIGLQLDDNDPSETPTSQGEAQSDPPAIESQMSTATSASSSSAVSMATGITTPDVEGIPAKDELESLLRLRVALRFIILSYVPQSYAATLNSMLASDESPVNFKPLDDHLEYLARLRAEALASRSFGDFSRKRNTYEDDDLAEARAEKKRKKEDDEKKKKAESKATRDLKKVDVKGMKKMSDFFGKGAVPRKK